VVAVVVSVGAGLLTTQAITRPLQELEQRAASLATSMYEPVSVEEMGQFKEIYSLNQSFEQMAIEIHERDQYLEEQVGARTLEVQEKAKELELANEILQQHTWDLTLVNEVNSAFLRGSNLDDVIDIVAEKTRDLYNFSGISGATVFLIDEAENQLVMQNNQLTTDVIPKFEKLVGRSVPKLKVSIENSNFHSRVIKSRKPHLLVDPKEIKQWLASYINESWIRESWLRAQTRKLLPQIQKLIGLNSVAAIPLYTGDKAIGLMEIFNDEIFTPEDINRLELVANQLSVAIERTRVDEENRVLKEFNEAIVQTVPGAIMAQDPEGYFTFANPEAINLLGYHPEELMGKHWKMLTPLDQQEIIMAADERRSNGVADSYEIELTHKDGHRFPVIIKGNPRYDAQTGEFFGTLVVLTDITDRKAVENAILQEKKFSDEIVNSLPGIFFIFNADGKIARWNKNFEHLTGYTIERIRSSLPIDFIAEVDRDKALAAINTGFTNGEATLEAHLKTKNGAVPYYLVVFLTSIDGVPHLMGNGIDISERVGAEQIIKQRTVELERSNQDLERFAYIASHDLQEPLRKVQAFGNRLQTKYASHLDDRGHDYLLRIQEAARRGQEMVDDLLVYSRVSTRGANFEPVDLNQVVAEVLADLKNGIELSQAVISVGELPTIRADQLQIHQLLHHLLDNAIKFKDPETPPKIGVHVTSADEHIILAVEDNGIGFEEQYLDKIFLPFQRLHGRTLYEGSGIGLAICRKIVERHFGTITANSTLGSGATFKITLPKG